MRANHPQAARRCPLCLKTKHVEMRTCPATVLDAEDDTPLPVAKSKTAALHDAAVEWLKDHATEESLGLFADTRADGALAKLLGRIDELAEKRTLARARGL